MTTSKRSTKIAAKKAPAKKTVAKKTPAKKTAAKKTQTTARSAAATKTAADVYGGMVAEIIAARPRSSADRHVGNVGAPG